MRCVSGSPSSARIRSMHCCSRSLPSAAAMRAAERRACRAASATSRAAWRTVRTRNRDAPEGRGLGRRTATLRQVGRHFTLLTESTRRVGTAWPAASPTACGRMTSAQHVERFARFGTAAKRGFRRKFINLVIGLIQRFTAGSGRFILASGTMVEIVNQIAGQVQRREQGWANRVIDSGGWGAPLLTDLRGALSARSRWIWSGDNMTQFVAATGRILIPRP